MRALTLCIGLGASWALSAQQAPLVLMQSIELPEVEGRIDHLAVDRDDQRLFVAALGNNTLEVVDLRANKWLRGIKGLHEPQGIAVVPAPNMIVVANGQSGDVEFRTGVELAIANKVSLGDDADNVRYDLTAKRVYVGYGAGALAAMDTDGKRLGEVPLAGHPESFQVERSGQRIFVNVPDAKQVAVVNRDTMKLLTTWPVTDARANFPMALDEGGHRLFIGCRQPAKVLVVDTSSRKVTASFDAVGDTDDLFYDATRKRLYVSGGEGFLDVFEDRAGKFDRVLHLPTAAGARTSLFVPELNRLYLAVPHRGSQKAEIRVYEVRN